jgi:ribosomal protein L37E
MKQEGIMMCCGMEPISGIRHVERMSPLQEDQEAYYIRCRSCGRMAYAIFTDATWPEAKERAREKWNRSIVEEINVADD